jgi:uncharacterized membrane protein YoaK (UPF0700 family)
MIRRHSRERAMVQNLPFGTHVRSFHFEPEMLLPVFFLFCGVVVARNLYLRLRQPNMQRNRWHRAALYCALIGVVVFSAFLGLLILLAFAAVVINSSRDSTN